MMRVITILLSISFALLLRHLLQIRRNWHIAKRLNLPIVISPFYPYSALWQLSNKPLRPFLRFIPEWLCIFPRVTWVGWDFADKGRVHRQLGPAFVIVSPGRNEIVLSEPDSVHEALTKYKAFRKPPTLYEPHSLFGRNVLTTNDEIWARHRKLTAPCFSERISRVVWQAASQQAQSMLEHAISPDSSSAYIQLIKDTKVIALHVLMEAGLGISQPFTGGVREPGPGHILPFGDALFQLVENVLIALVLSPLLKPWLLPYLPTRLREVYLATKECRMYFDEMIEERRAGKATVSGNPNTNLISALVKASNQADEEKDRGSGSGGLTQDEMRGNIYIFAFAGHETTANAMAYAISLLAAYPKWLDWVAEEINTVLGRHDRAVYEEVFPRLKRCQALMYETLRLYGPVPWIPRETCKPETVSLGGNKAKASVVVPPNTDVHLNLYARHVSAEIWGSDALQFRPGRFIVLAGDPVPAGWTEHGSASGIEEKLVAPPLSHFSPWSLGPRICPGMKFSQVEFVATMCVLFSQARVSPAVSEIKSNPKSGKPGGEAYQELRNTIEDSALRGSSLVIMRPEDVRLAWKMQK